MLQFLLSTPILFLFSFPAKFLQWVLFSFQLVFNPLQFYLILSTHVKKSTNVTDCLSLKTMWEPGMVTVCTAALWKLKQEAVNSKPVWTTEWDFGSKGKKLKKKGKEKEKQITFSYPLKKTKPRNLLALDAHGEHPGQWSTLVSLLHHSSAVTSSFHGPSPFWHNYPDFPCSLPFSGYFSFNNSFLFTWTLRGMFSQLQLLL